MSPAPTSQSAHQPADPAWWRLPLLAGVCFGLGYGVVQRLMVMEFSPLVQLGQAFEVREFPGTSLEALRLRTGAGVQSIRGDLGVLELEEQEKQKARPSEASLEPAPPIRPLPAEQPRFNQPLDGTPDPEPVQPEPVQPQPVSPEPLPLPEPPGQAPDPLTP
jgi:hypothetical protein